MPCRLASAVPCRQLSIPGPEHPLCQDECEDAQLNNEDYQSCLNEAVDELVSFKRFLIVLTFFQEICLKSCPAEIGCHNLCYEIYTEKLFLCPCIEQQVNICKRT